MNSVRETRRLTLGGVFLYAVAKPTLPKNTPALSGAFSFGSEVVVHEDFDALIPAHMAAVRVGVSRQLINYWRTSRRLRVAEVCGGQPLFRLGDVLEAESSARAVPRGHRARIAGRSSRNPDRAA